MTSRPTRGALGAFALLFAVLVLPPNARAQRGASFRDTTPQREALPPDVERDVVAHWNAPVALRSSEPTSVAEGQEIHGDVAVRNGTLTIVGHVTGSVVVINADVVLRPTARIDGDLTVVGGVVRDAEGSDVTARAHVGGNLRTYAASLRYWDTGGHIVAGEPPTEMPWWWPMRHSSDGKSYTNALRVAEAGPYNRVEGLPITIGPDAFQELPWGSVRLNTSMIVKTAPQDGDFGHDLSTEVRIGHTAGFGVGANLFNRVAAVEPGQLSDLETALESFLFHRDYRDYYQRHGGSGSLSAFDGRSGALTGTLSDERWTSRRVTNPFTVLDEGAGWRANPDVDEARMHIATLAGRWDTRSDPVDPWSGWFLTANVEHGSGHLDFIAPTSEPRRIAPDSAMVYTRGLLDARRYNRLSPSVQLNVRVFFAGWLAGDQLPTERRVSAEGAAELPGFDFRTGTPATDVATCSVGLNHPAGLPAECDRVALGQLEYRNETFCSATWWSSVVQTLRAATSSCAITWVGFADLGRGWMVGPASGAMVYSGRDLPPLSTFRSDIGGGLDFGIVGVYIAKALSDRGEPANIFLRLQRRF